MIVISIKFYHNCTLFFSRLSWLTDSVASFHVLRCNIYIQSLAYCFDIISLFVVRSSSYFLNLSEINWTESCKSFSCFSLLICCSRVDIAKTKISFIYFSIFLKQLKESSTHTGNFKLSAKISSDISLKLLMLHFSSPIFFSSSPLFRFFDWSLRYLFFDDLSNNFVISFNKDILKTVFF